MPFSSSSSCDSTLTLSGTSLSGSLRRVAVTTTVSTSFTSSWSPLADCCARDGSGATSSMAMDADAIRRLAITTPSRWLLPAILSPAGTTVNIHSREREYPCISGFFQPNQHVATQQARTHPALLAPLSDAPGRAPRAINRYNASPAEGPCDRE